MVIKVGLATKVSKVLETLKSLYYLVAPDKMEYLMVTPGATTPSEPLLVAGLLVLHLKVKAW